MESEVDEEVPRAARIVIGVLAVVILVEDIFVCLIVWRHRHLRTYTNWFVVSLAFSDALFAAVIVPTNFLAPDEYVLNGYFVSIILLVNIGNLFAVTLDRYLAVIKPLMYSYTMTKHFRKILISSWVIPILYSLLPLCWESDLASKPHSIYLLCMLVLMIILPYIFILIAYIRIFGEVSRLTKNLTELHGTNTPEYAAATREGKRVSGEARVARVFAIIAGIFILTWLPVIYMTVALALKRLDIVPKSLPVISWFTLTLGTLMNAPVYAFLKGDFRKAIQKTLHLNTGNDNIYLPNSPPETAISSYTIVSNSAERA